VTDNDFAEAKAQLPALVELALTMNDLYSSVTSISTSTGWRIECDREGGQPNGAGETEPSDYREWFTEEREDHHRYSFTFTGPWLPGARQEILDRTRIRRAATARTKQRNEETILQKADEIRARRAAEDNG